MKKSSVQIWVLSAVLCLMAGCSDDKKKTTDVDTPDPCVENPASCQVKPKCTENAQECQNNNVVICLENDWKTKITCKDTQLCNPVTYKCDDKSASIICNEGAIRCLNSTSSIICENNAWKKHKSCGENLICDGQSGECVAPRCIPGNKCNGKVLTKCSPSGQESTITCGDNQNCDEAVGNCVNTGTTVIEEVKCTLPDSTKLDNGKSICNGGKLLTCAEGDLQSDTCTNGVCRDGENACSALKDCQLGDQKLAHGEKACSENNVIICKDGEKTISQKCEGDTKCMASAGKLTCGTVTPETVPCTAGSITVNDGANICVENVLKTCTAGTLSEGTDCATTNQGKSLCKADRCVAAPCGDLASGNKSCSADLSQIVICTDGQLSNVAPPEACSESQVCKPGATPTCEDKPQPKVYTKIAAIHADFDAITSLNPKGCTDDGKNYLTLADVQIEGIVTAKKTNGFFVQDPDISSGKNAGIFVNCTSSNCEISSGKVAAGDKVKITSNAVGYNKCQLWVRTNDTNQIHVERLAENQTINIAIVNITDINSGIHNDYNGSLVTLNDVLPVRCEDGQRCILRDINDNNIVATNYINTKTVSIISNYLSLENVRLNLSGIVYYNSDISNTGIGPSTISEPLECSGSEVKCHEGKTFTCTKDGTWDAGTDCPSVTNATALCNEMGSSCTFECSDGYTEDYENNVCIEISTPTPQSNCQDINGQEVLNGKNGCSDNKTRSICTNGQWGNVAAHCPEDDNGDTSCKNNRCSLKCHDGYKYNSSTKKCDAILCTSYYKTYKPGESGCNTTWSIAKCGPDGKWQDKETCRSNVEHAEDHCDAETDKCTFTCEDGYKPSADGTKCEAPGGDCTIRGRFKVPNGSWGCTLYDDENYIEHCENGVFTESHMCANYCELGELYCFIDDEDFDCAIDIDEDWFEDENGEEVEYAAITDISAYYNDPGTTMTAYVACIDTDNDDKALDEWTKIPAEVKSVDDRSYSFTIAKDKLPKDKGSYYCVGVVDALGGGEFICPDNYHMKGIRSFGDETASDLLADDDSYVKTYIVP